MKLSDIIEDTKLYGYVNDGVNIQNHVSKLSILIGDTDKEFPETNNILRSSETINVQYLLKYSHNPKFKQQYIDWRNDHLYPLCEYLHDLGKAIHDKISEATDILRCSTYDFNNEKNYLVQRCNNLFSCYNDMNNKKYIDSLPDLRIIDKMYMGYKTYITYLGYKSSELKELNLKMFKFFVSIRNLYLKLLDSFDEIAEDHNRNKIWV